MPMYVIEFVIKLTVICFGNSIKSLLNVAKRISVNGIGQCGIKTNDFFFLPFFDMTTKD